MWLRGQAHTYIRWGLLDDGAASLISSDDVEFHVPARDGRTKTISLVVSAIEEKGSDLTTSLWPDDDTKVSGAMIIASELQAHTIVVPWEPYHLGFGRSEDVVRSRSSKKTPLYEALPTAQQNPSQLVMVHTTVNVQRE